MHVRKTDPQSNGLVHLDQFNLMGLVTIRVIIIIIFYFSFFGVWGVGFVVHLDGS